ncbi:hypothetical protein E1100_00015 [Vibrio owensii]|uniref:TcfC E-set like domain-containing protein n=1 Tax=Vibrio owensii TaxID=696485 RepID=UPI00104F977A|nr:TcfC E-set like domain-containing protein [Vibrio owensii]TDE25347.1 hypothetical protein E1100_00015 [Vibrio owensii]
MKLFPIFCFYLVFSTSFAFAKDEVTETGMSELGFPLEFADFFEEKRELIDVSIAGGWLTTSIQADVTYETFKLVGDKENREALRQFLKEQKITPSAAENIESSLVKGIKANPSCKGKLALCIPEDIVGSAEYVFDFDTSSLKIFVSSEMLSTSFDEVEYYSESRADNALINWSDVYFYVSKEGQDTFNWTNNSILGLPLGYLSVDSQYIGSEDDFNIYKATYDIEFQDTRAIVGYQDNNKSPLNTTDFLGYGASYSGTAITIGSSKNLVKGKNKSLQRVVFYAPQSAQMEVYQGDRLLISKVVNEGQQSIGYDELPSGVYTITIILKQGSNEISREQQQIVNTSQFSIGVGEMDYRVEIGYLDDISNPSSPYTEYDSGEKTYARGGYSYRPSESLLLASGMTSNLENTEFQFGGIWAINSFTNIQYTGSVFDSNDTYQYLLTSVGPFSFSVRDVDVSSDNEGLSNLLYGDTSYTQWSAGASTPLLGGSGFVSYFRYESFDDKLDSSTSDNVSFTWTKNDVFGGTVSLNSTYTKYGDGQDALDTKLLWSYKFNDEVSGLVGVSLDNQGFTEFRNGYSYNKRTGTQTLGSSVDVKLKPNDGSEAEWSTTVSGTRTNFSYNAYGYLNSKGQRSISGSLSGTQIVSPSGIKLTQKRGTSFVELAPSSTSDDDENSRSAIQYNVLRDGSFWYRDNIVSDEAKLIDVKPYSEVDVKLNADDNSLEVENSEYKMFAMPGMYHRLESEVVRLESQVFILNNMFSEPVNALRCVGDGCKSVEELSQDGVFRVNYSSNERFNLLSGNKVCVYDNKKLGEKYIEAFCLPGLNEETSLVPWQDMPNKSDNYLEQKDLLYIGKYETVHDAEDILQQLNESNVDTKVVKVGNLQYIYVQYYPEYTAQQIDLLDNLNKYVIHNLADPEQLFSVR